MKFFLNDCLFRTCKVDGSGKEVSVFLPIRKQMLVSQIHCLLDSSNDLNIQYSIILKNPYKKTISLGQVTSSSDMLQCSFQNKFHFQEGLYELVFNPLSVGNDLNDKMTFDIAMYD